MVTASGGDTVVPAVLALEAIGFTLTEREGLMRAESAAGTFVAEDPVTLLGLVKLVELRGAEWTATDTQIDDVLRRFGWDGGNISP